jgi:hypothetical protein
VRVRPKQLATDDARARVREICDPWDMLDVNFDASAFHRVLPTPELRRAYMAEFPADYLDVCGFNHQQIKYWDVSRMMENPEQGCFRRWDASGFLRKYAPQPFDLPDLSSHVLGLHGYRKAEHDALAHDVQLARARWWISCKLPVTPGEIEWLRTYLPELVTEAAECPVDTWDAAHVPATLEMRPEPSPAPSLRLVQ